MAFPKKVWNVYMSHACLSPPCGETLNKQPDLAVHALQYERQLSVLKIRGSHVKVYDLHTSLFSAFLPATIFSSPPLPSPSSLTRLHRFRTVWTSTWVKLRVSWLVVALVSLWVWEGRPGFLPCSLSAIFTIILTHSEEQDVCRSSVAENVHARMGGEKKVRYADYI